MLTAFVVRATGKYIVKSAKVTPTGFTNIHKLHGYSSLEEAKKKADTANYIFNKLQKFCNKRKEACCE